MLSRDPQLLLKPGRGLLLPSCATARDRTFREKDEPEYSPMRSAGKNDEICSENRTKRVTSYFGALTE